MKLVATNTAEHRPEIQFIAEPAVRRPLSHRIRTAPARRGRSLGLRRPAARSGRIWSIEEALGGLGVWWILTYLFIPIIPLLARQAGLPEYMGQRAAVVLVGSVVGIVVELAVLGYAFLLATRKHHLSLQALGFRRFPAKPGLIALPLAAAIGQFAIVRVCEAVVFAAHIRWLLPAPNTATLAYYHSPLFVYVVFIATCLVAPVAEEVYFRGVLFQSLLANRLSFRGRALGQTSRFWVAALLSGAVFAIGHQQVGLLIPFTLTGALLAWTYRRGNSIWANILAHGIYNATVLALTLVALQHHP